MRHDFTIEVAGQTRRCWRDVHGDRVKTQHVYVVGVGDKGDLALYGDGHFAAAIMPNVAKNIALQIAQTHLANNPLPSTA